MGLTAWSDEVEQISQQYAERFGVERTSPWFLLKLQEEVGELTQAYLQVTGQGRDKGRTAEELHGDLRARWPTCSRCCCSSRATTAWTLTQRSRTSGWPTALPTRTRSSDVAA